jgi:hypothetical protein
VHKRPDQQSGGGVRDVEISGSRNEERRTVRIQEVPGGSTRGYVSQAVPDSQKVTGDGDGEGEGEERIY